MQLNETINGVSLRIVITTIPSQELIIEFIRVNICDHTYHLIYMNITLIVNIFNL